MAISQKCQYALRAIFELARRQGQGPTKISLVAASQAIPPRFLEVILGQLKQAGFVESKRGIDGGYFLVSSPQQLTVGQVIRFIEGPIAPVNCLGTSNNKQECPLYDNCVFVDMWERAQQAVSEVYDGTTFADLVEQAQKKDAEYVACYAI